MERYSNSTASHISFTLAAAAPLGTKMKISAADTIAPAGPGDIVIGTLFSVPSTYPGNAGITTPYNLVHEGVAAAAIAAGVQIVVGTASQTGVQRFIAYNAETHTPDLIVGVSLTAAAEADATFKALWK